MLSIKVYLEWCIKSILKMMDLNQVVTGNDVMSYITNFYKNLYDKCFSPCNFFFAYPRDGGVVAVGVVAIAHLPPYCGVLVQTT